jgi:hypothetical protein
MFIDKYSQIYRILLPICNTLAQIPSLEEKPAIHAYIENEFGSVDNLRREILADFFRHGFDGSGADNVFFHLTLGLTLFHHNSSFTMQVLVSTVG